MLSLNIYFQVLTIAAHHIKLSFQKMKEKESNIIILGIGISTKKTLFNRV